MLDKVPPDRNGNTARSKKMIQKIRAETQYSNEGGIHSRSWVGIVEIQLSRHPPPIRERSKLSLQKLMPFTTF
jgi:hypothetical protein